MSFRNTVVREAHIFLFALTLRFIIMEFVSEDNSRLFSSKHLVQNCIEWQERVVFISVRNWKVHFGSISNILPFNIVPFCQAYGRYSWLKQKGTIKFTLFLMQWLVLKPIVLIKEQDSSEKKKSSYFWTTAAHWYKSGHFHRRGLLNLRQ